MDYIQELLECYPDSFINSNFEFIPHPKSQCGLRLHDVNSRFDLEVKVVQWLSRGYKEMPYGKPKPNLKHNHYMCNGFNQFLKGVDLKPDHIDFWQDNPYQEIYTKLGNGINKDLAIEFVLSEYDLEVLMK